MRLGLSLCGLDALTNSPVRDLGAGVEVGVGTGVQLWRLGKCQASKNVTGCVSPGASSIVTASEAIGASAFTVVRFSSKPSLAKSSQKSSRESPQLREAQAVR